MMRGRIQTRQAKIERYRRNAEVCLERSASEGSKSQVWVTLSAFWWERAREAEVAPEENFIE